MKKNKILIVTPYFYPKIGGLENYVFNILKGLRKYGWEIVVITSNHENDAYKEEIIERMKIYRLPRQFKVSNTPISFKWKKQIREIIQKEKPDVINAHTPVPFISDVTARVANKLKIPFVLTYHGGSMLKNDFPWLLFNPIIYFHQNITLRKTINYSKKIICSSDFVKNVFLNKFGDKTVTITPAVDLDLFKPNPQKVEENNILFVGRIEKTSRWKGIGYLIRSMSIIKSKIPNVMLHLVGEGDNLEKFNNQIKQSGLNESAKFIGSLKDKKLVEEYNKSKLLILPSTSNAESFGMVLIEAMACKKPVVGSNMGGIPYVIDNGINGILVPPKNPGVLAEAILKLLKNPGLAKKMGEAGYKKVKENFTWDVQVKKTDEVFKSLI